MIGNSFDPLFATVVRYSKNKLGMLLKPNPVFLAVTAPDIASDYFLLSTFRCYSLECLQADDMLLDVDLSVLLAI
jgi:hypothetical protein